MGFELIQNQPIDFGATDACSSTDYVYLQPVQNTDKTIFQVKLNNCQDDQIVVNPNFDTDVSGWTAGSGITATWVAGVNAAKIDLTSTGGGIFSQTDVYGYGGYYKTTFKVVSFQGTPTVTLIHEGGGTILNTSDLIFGETYTVYHWADDADLQLNVGGQIGDFVIFDEIDTREINLNGGVGIFDYPNGDLQQVVYINDQLTVDNQDSDVYSLVDNFLTVTLDWSLFGLPNGCYQVGLLDPCVNSNTQVGFLNWNFINDRNLVLSVGGGSSATLVIDKQTSVLDYDAAVTSGSPVGTCTWDEDVVIGITYEVTFQVSNASNVDVSFLLGGTATNYAAISDGLYSFTFTAVSVGSNRMTMTPTSASASLDVEFVKLRINATSSENNVANQISNGFNLAAHVCTAKLSACQDETESFGFRFGATGFVPSMRIDYKIFNPEYDEEYIGSESSLGRKQVVYYQRRKFKRLITKYVPEYLLDFLTSLRGYDHLYIDDVEYIVKEPPELTYNENLNDNAQVEMLVETKQQLFRNVKQSAEGAGCSTLTDCVIDPVSEACLIDPVTGEPIVGLG